MSRSFSSASNDASFSIVRDDLIARDRVVESLHTTEQLILEVSR